MTKITQKLRKQCTALKQCFCKSLYQKIVHQILVDYLLVDIHSFLIQYILYTGQRDRSAIPAFTRWTAPEILCNPTADESNLEVFSPAVDTYSFGMVLWEVVSLTDPFEEISDDEEVWEGFLCTINLICRY